MKRKLLKGFTLVEMLVTVSIITLISLTFLSYSKSQESINNLNRFNQKLLSDLKETRDNALNMKDLVNMNQLVYCGWGIHFDSNNNEYFLFVDKCLSGQKRGNLFYDSNDIKKPSVKISQGIKLETIIQDLVFLPPQPIICINRSCNPLPQEIYLRSNTFSSKTIINPIGLIYFEYAQ